MSLGKLSSFSTATTHGLFLYQKILTLNAVQRRSLPKGCYAAILKLLDRATEKKAQGEKQETV